MRAGRSQEGDEAACGDSRVDVRDRHGRSATVGRSVSRWVLAVGGLAILAATGFVVGQQSIWEADSPVRVRMTAHQSWWEVEYLGDDPSQHFTTANELHLPAGQPASIELRSDDVIRAFRLPSLSARHDMFPGRTDTLEFTPRRLGEFRGTCADAAGEPRVTMALPVFVDEPAAFDAWRLRQLAPARAPASAALRKGEQAFVVSACLLCHEIRGTIAGSRTGPDLTHVGSRNTLAAGARRMNPGSLAAWLSDPQQVEASAHVPRDETGSARLDEIASYLASLK